MLTLFLLFLTGLANTFLLHGGLQRRTIKEKLFIFFIIVIVSLVHDLWAGKKAIGSRKHALWARWLGLTNLILGLLAVYMGVRIRLGL